MFYLVGIFRTSSPRDSISSNPEKSGLRKRGEESGYIEVCNKGKEEGIKAEGLVESCGWGPEEIHKADWLRVKVGQMK